MGSGAFLGTFCAHKKYPRGVGPRGPHLAHVIQRSAERPLRRAAPHKAINTE